MLCNVIRRCRRRWAHAPVIHAASHFYHEKRVTRVSISMHACDPVPIVTGLHFSGCQSSAINVSPCDTIYCTTSFYFVQLTMDDGSSETCLD